MVELLLERGANLLAVDKCQRTALILAVQCGSANIVSLLLQQQIDIFSQDTLGRTAEDYAVLNQFTGIQQLISECKEKQQSEQEKMNVGVIILSENTTLHDVCNHSCQKTEQRRLASY
ncbi:uncharacterized protein LOC144582540 [Callithrix jacchus]